MSALGALGGLSAASALHSEPVATLANLPVQALVTAMQGPGIWLNLGAAVVRVRGNSLPLAQQLQQAYRHFPADFNADWADVHVQLGPVRGLRHWFGPRQVGFNCDGRQIFDAFPADSPLPLFEWGCNWFLGQRLNDCLLLHAGVLEKDGHAIVLPAIPGSGKSTLTAALALRGWRLLSDEFGALDPATGVFHPVLKPTALKNKSIAVIRRFAPEVEMGPEFPNTRKGTVVHIAASRDAVQRRHETALPGMVVLPRWQAGSATEWTAVAEHTLFAELAFNAFNYRVLGVAGFKAAIGMVRQCPAWRLVYSDLDEAIATIEGAWPYAPQRRQAQGGA